MTASDRVCPECARPPVPGFERCYSHLDNDDRVRVIRSTDPAVRAAATGQWRKGKLNEPGAWPQASEPDSDSRIVCPHCQTAGKVRSEQVKVKRGVSGGKATAAVLTGGLSTLGTGLSRKQTVTSMRCGNCRTTWTVD